MFPLDDPIWKELAGGYRVPYDASVPLRGFASDADPESIWDELWQGLHHQGDVGEASYAAVPHLVRIYRDRGLLDWNLYALASTIEIQRHAPHNPPLPDWLETDYVAAWGELLELALRDLRRTDDALLTRSILGTIALAKGNPTLGRLLIEFDENEIESLYKRFYGIGE